MENILVPYEFISDRITVSWFDIKWGYEKGFIGLESIIKHAEHMCSLDQASQIELELSFKTKMDIHEIESITEYLSASCINPDESITKEKWLYLVLSWVLFNKVNYSKPLEVVESIYADFDYPESIESFIGYMPANDGYDPSIHSDTENKERLFKNWEKYLERESIRLNLTN